MKPSPTSHIDTPIQLILSLLVFSLFFSVTCSASQEKTLIGDPGGDTQEMRNTLVSLTLGAAADIDFIELDLIATKDQHVIVFHSPNLSPDTDVADLFPEKVREDGGYYAVDFTIDEIRQLRRKNDGFQHVSTPLLGIPTLNEYLSLVRHLESRLKTAIAIAPIILYPEIHLKAQVDLSSLTLQVLQRYGYGSADSPLLLQCFNGDELQRIKEELMPELAMSLPLIQRIGPAEETSNSLLPSYDHSWIFTRFGTRMVSSYASGIGIDSSFVLDEMGNPLNEGFFENIRALDLNIYVSGKTDGFLEAAPLSSDARMYDHYFTAIGVDGIIASSPMKILDFLYERKKEKETILRPLLPLPGNN